MSNALTDSRRKPERQAAGSPMLMLAMATIGFAVNFWAWALLSPLGPLFREKGTLGTLSESDVALLVAVPVIVGSLGRIVVGALTDRYGGLVMFPIVSAATIVPVLFIGFFAQTSYAALLFGGFFLGVAGTYVVMLALYHDDLGYLSDVPLLYLALAVVGLPLAAAAAGWLLAGREPPAIARPVIE